MIFFFLFKFHKIISNLIIRLIFNTMTIRQIIKDALLKLKVKYPHEEEDDVIFDLQNYKDYFEKKNNQRKNFENFIFYISEKEVLVKPSCFKIYL